MSFILFFYFFFRIVIVITLVGTCSYLAERFFFFFLVQRNDNNYYLRAAACVETRCKVIVENHGRRRVREAATARAPVKSLSRPAYARGLVCITHDTRSCERRDVTRKKKNNNNK